MVLQVTLDSLARKRPSLEPSSDAGKSSVAQRAPWAWRLSENSPGRKFLAALDNAAYEREDLAMLLRELVKSLWWGQFLDVSIDDVWHLDAEKQLDPRSTALQNLCESRAHALRNAYPQ